jgi:ribosomal protein S25
MTFFLSFNHLADRLEIHPMRAQRILRQLEIYGLIRLLKKGTRRAARVKGEAGTYRWQLAPPQPKP